MRLLLCALFASSLFACNKKTTNSSVDLDARVKQYMKDTLVKQMNDPASYEFVSMTVDTNKGEDQIALLQEFTKDSAVLSAKDMQDYKTQIADLQSRQGYSDSILRYYIDVSFRGKNAMGAKVVNSKRLIYSPQTDAITQASE